MISLKFVHQVALLALIVLFVSELRPFSCQKFFHRHPTAVQLHFIQCPFPNRFQFGSEKNLTKFYQIFQTELDSVRKQKTIFRPRKKFQTESDSVWKNLQYRRKTHLLIDASCLHDLLTWRDSDIFEIIIPNRNGIGSEKFSIFSLPSKRLACAKWTQYTS